jgi:hypothetical protein
MANPTATIAIAPTGNIQVGQKCQANVTITNSTTASISLVTFAPYAYATSVGLVSAPNVPVSFGNYSVATGDSKLIAGTGGNSSTLGVSFPITFYGASTQPSYSNQAIGSGSALTTNTYSIGCICYFSDGSTCQATESTVTVTSPTMFNGR